MTEKSVTFKLMNIFSGTFMRNFAYKGMAIVYLYMAHFFKVYSETVLNDSVVSCIFPTCFAVSVR